MLIFFFLFIILYLFIREFFLFKTEDKIYGKKTYIMIMDIKSMA